MIQATTFAERVSDKLERIVGFFIGNPCGPLANRLVPFLHSRREFVITKEPWHTSHGYHYQTGKPEWIPVGERVTLYFWRGHTYRFWRGEMTSADACIEEGLFDRYKWDMEKYEPIKSKSNDELSGRREVHPECECGSWLSPYSCPCKRGEQWRKHRRKEMIRVGKK